MDLFVTCSRHIEELLAAELRELGFAEVQPAFCGCYVGDSSMEAIYKINYLSRLASRVQLPLRRFRCHGERDLYKEALEIEWEHYIPPGKTIAIDANVQHPQLRHSLHAAQVVKDAICDRLRKKRGFRPSVNVKQPDVQLNLYITKDRATISFDTSGAPLYKRNYRTETVFAPLQETLAAAILRLANYNDQSLCDPCCGSGTFLIEAAMIATQTPAGYFRMQWGFFHLPGFQRRAWRALRADWDAKRTELTVDLFGIDRDPASARTNIKRTRFPIEVAGGDFQEVEARPFQLVVTNPPLGKRLEGDHSALYDALDSFIRRCGAHGYLLSPDKPGTELRNGGETVFLREVKP